MCFWMQYSAKLASKNRISVTLEPKKQKGNTYLESTLCGELRCSKKIPLEIGGKKLWPSISKTERSCLIYVPV